MSTVIKVPRSCFGSTTLKISKIKTDEIQTPEIENPDDTYVEIKDKVYVVDGSSSAPAYSFTSQTGTGIYRSSNLLGFSLNGNSSILCGSSSTTISQPILEINGSASTPSYSFGSDSKTGFFKYSGPAIGMSLNGTVVLASGTDSAIFSTSLSTGTNSLTTGSLTCGSILSDSINTGSSSILCGGSISSGSISSSGTIRSVAGTSLAPGHSFSTGTSSGMFLEAAGTLGFSPSGTTRLSISNSVAYCGSDQLTIRDGTVSAPSLGFDNDKKTGIYSITTGQMGISANSTLSLDISSSRIISPIQPTLILSVANNTTQSLTSGVETKLTVYTNEISRIGFSSPSSGDITVPVTGIYMIIAFVTFANNTSGMRLVSITNSSGTRYSSVNYSSANFGTNNSQCNISTMVSLTANDVINIRAQQDSGSVLGVGDVINSNNTRQRLAIKLLV